MAVKWKWNNNTGGGNVPADLANRVQTLENEAVKLSGAQNISGVKTITATVEALKFNPGSDSSAYMSGYKSGNQRVWYLGKSSSTDNHLRIGADRGNIKLEPNGVVDLSNKKISYLADPAANTDAATKQYVDNRIKKRVLTITNTQGNTYTIQPTSGYEIISIMAGRKRTAEGYYFFNYQSSLNFQLFMDSSGAYKLYTEGPVSGFNGDYKIIEINPRIPASIRGAAMSGVNFPKQIVDDMGIFFKSKRSNKNSSDNNIKISNSNNDDIKIGLDVMFKFMKEMRDDLKGSLREVSEEIKRTSKRINYIEHDLTDLKVRVAVLENDKNKKGSK